MSLGVWLVLKRVSRGGMAMRTEARPVAAAEIWVPATSAKDARLTA
jgi:hypothetical protein